MSIEKSRQYLYLHFYEIMIQERRRSKKSYHHGNLREAILNESILWIRKRGVESLSLREIAKKIGVTHSAPNKHFAKKESLLASLIEMGFSQFKDALMEATKELSKNPKEAFIGMGIAYVKFARENPEIYRLMFSNHIENISEYPACEKSGLEAFEVLLSTVITLQEKSILKKKDPIEISYLIWSLTHGYVMLHLDNRLSGINTNQKQSNPIVFDDMLFKNMMNSIGSGILS